MGEGAAKAIPGPPCAVQSTTREGQKWVAGTIERGISALKWERPKRECTPDAKSSQPVVAPKKPSLWKRISGKKR